MPLIGELRFCHSRFRRCNLISSPYCVARDQFLRNTANPQPKQKQLQSGLLGGATHAPEDPKIAALLPLH
jgi:hypothetical protein